MWDVTHVAICSEREIMVIATLTDPISSSFMSSFRLFEQSLAFVVELKWWFINCFSRSLIGWLFRLLSINLKTLDFHSFSFFLQLIWRILIFTLHMRRFPSGILGRFWFFAPIAFLSSFKVIVLTFWALPSTLRKFEISLCFLQMTLFTHIVWRNFRRTVCLRWRLSRIWLLNTLLCIATIFFQRCRLINLKINPSHIFLELI